MSDGARSLWQAAFDALSADAALQGFLGLPPRVFDHVPDGAPFPYLVIGDGATLDAGTDTGEGSLHRLLLHVWSRARGRAECRALMDAARAVLHEAALPLSGRVLTYFRFEGSDVLREPDGRTWHGLLRFTARTEPDI